MSRSPVASEPGKSCSSKFVLLAAVAVAGSLACQVAAAQASSPTRADVKAETKAANKAGQLAAPVGRGPSGASATGTSHHDAR